MADTQEIGAGLTLDAGALIAVERNERNVIALLMLAGANGFGVTIPAGVLGQGAEAADSDV